MSALRCSCTRYFSPSRVQTNTTRTLGTDSNRQPTLSRRGRPTNRLACEGPITFAEHRSRSFVSNKRHPHAATVEPRNFGDVGESTGVKAVLTGWSRATRDYADLGSMLKAVASLNIELPKLWKKADKVTDDVQGAVTSSNMNTATENSTGECSSTTQQHSVDCSGSKASGEPDHNDILMNKSDANLAQNDSSHNETVSGYPSAKLSASATDSESATAAPSPTRATAPKSAASTLMQHITSFLPDLQALSKVARPAVVASEVKAKVKVSSKKELAAKVVVPRSSIEKKARGLVRALRASAPTASKLKRMEELGKHLTEHPDAKNIAVREKAVPFLLKLRASTDNSVKEQAMELLSLVGYVDPVRGRGIRLLTLDGGGTRGLVAIEMLRRLQETCKRPLHEMFDYVCGVSTGSLVAAMVVAYRISMDEAEELYMKFSTEVFAQYRLRGVGKLVMSQGYYDALLWEKILQENIGLKSFLDTMRDPLCPKLSAVSALMNTPKVTNYLFRNYNLPPGVQSQFPGDCKYALWEAIRASSAAPGYYEEFKLDEWIHQDGGLLSNNPTAIAIHECKLLWPSDDLQCVVSIGTGRYEPTSEAEPTYYGLKNKINKIVQSATDTEAVHSMLNDLLAPSTYFRFNPYMSEDFQLNEISPSKWEQMKRDTQMYCRKNESKIQKAALRLAQPKHLHQKAVDWAKLKNNTLG